MSKYEVIPLPPEDEELRFGDELWITYKLFQFGTWFIGLQVSRLEQNLEADGRFMVSAYQYDPEAGTVLFKLRRNPHATEKVQLAGGFAIGVVIGLVGAVAVYFAYDAGKKVQLMRDQAILQSILDDPMFPEAEKERVRKAQDQMAEETGTGLQDLAAAGKDLAGMGTLVALAVLAYVLFGD